MHQSILILRQWCVFVIMSSSPVRPHWTQNVTTYNNKLSKLVKYWRGFKMNNQSTETQQYWCWIHNFCWKVRTNISSAYDQCIMFITSAIYCIYYILKVWGLFYVFQSWNYSISESFFFFLIISTCVFFDNQLEYAYTAFLFSLIKVWHYVLGIFSILLWFYIMSFFFFF